MDGVKLKLIEGSLAAVAREAVQQFAERGACERSRARHAGISLRNPRAVTAQEVVINEDVIRSASRRLIVYQKEASS